MSKFEKRLEKIAFDHSFNNKEGLQVQFKDLIEEARKEFQELIKEQEEHTEIYGALNCSLCQDFIDNIISKLNEWLGEEE